MRNLSIIDDTIQLFSDNLNFTELSPSAMIAAMVSALVCGIVIYLVYRFCYRGIVYSENFNVLLVMITAITAFIIMTISSNVVLSLGMVGALSIVRFRTAIKDPLDLLYLFWAITTGITAGAGMYILALIAALVMFLMIMIFYHKQQNGRIYILVVHYVGDTAGDDVIRALGKIKYFVKSKTLRKDKTEMAIEVFCKNNDTFFMEKIREINGVEDSTLIQYNGEYHG